MLSSKAAPVTRRFAHDDTWVDQMAGSFANLLKTGGDALLWTLIRIGLEECENEEVVGLAERRGYDVHETSQVEPLRKLVNSLI